MNYDYPLVNQALRLFAVHTTMGSQDPPEDPKQLRRFKQELERAALGFVDAFAAWRREGFAVSEIEGALKEITSIRGRLLKEHEYRRVWSYLPPEPNAFLRQRESA